MENSNVTYESDFVQISPLNENRWQIDPVGLKTATLTSNVSTFHLPYQKFYKTINKLI